MFEEGFENGIPSCSYREPKKEKPFRRIKKTIRQKINWIYRHLCYILPHKWEMWDHGNDQNGPWWGNLGSPLQVRYGTIICKRCYKHLFNGITGIKWKNE